MSSTDAVSHQTRLLSALLQLNERARSAQSREALQFTLVNESYSLQTYRTSYLWLIDEGLCAVSGVVAPDTNSALSDSINALFRHWHSGSGDELRKASELDSQTLQNWRSGSHAHLLARHSVILPVKAGGKHFAGGYWLLTRDESFNDASLELLQRWLDDWSYCFSHQQFTQGFSVRRLFKRLTTRSQPSEKKSNRIREVLKWAIVPALAVVLSLPVKLSVLAPAEMVPENPTVIRAPMDGVIDSMHVRPNQSVEVGDTLFEFDRISLKNKLDVADWSLNTLKARHKQLQQRALVDAEARSQLASIESEIDEKQVEIQYLTALSERAVVKASESGIVLLDDPQEWIGKPVMTGEKILTLAREDESEIEAWLSPADMIDLPEQAAVSLYLNANPTEPVHGTLRYVSYQAQQQSDNQFAYRVRASLRRPQGMEPEAEYATGEPQYARIGLRGTLRLVGEEVSLAYWVLRKPVAALRTWVGI